MADDSGTQVQRKFHDGLRALQRGQRSVASDIFTQVLDTEPEHAGAMNGLALVAAQQNNRDEAERLWRQAMAAAPDFAAPHINLGNLERRSAPLNAVEHYRKGIALAPEDSQAVFALASLLEDIGQIGDAAGLAQQAMERFPGHAGLTAVLARGMLEEGRAPDAKTLLDRVSLDGVPARVAQAVRYTAAATLDRLDDPVGALAAAGRGRELLKGLFAPAIEGAPVELSNVRALASYYAGTTPLHDPNGAGSDLVFLIGFPNSGADRIARVLERHPRIRLRRDSAALTNAVHAAFGNPVIPRALDDAAVASGRAEYSRLFGLVAEDGRILIDALDMNLTQIGFAAQVFPGARFLVVTRHPAAACLASCLRGYEVTPTSANLLTFESAVTFFEAVAEGWEGLKPALSERTLAVDHADLAHNSGETLCRILAFLGLGGTPAPEAVATLTIDPNPPIGDWHRYKALLPADALARAIAWAEKLGYG